MDAVNGHGGAWAQPPLLDPADFPTFTPTFTPSDYLDGLPEPPHPINWNDLTADEAEAEWLDLNAWVNWLRRTYGLPPTLVPPLWHRHDELVWELSALHVAWLGAYHRDGPATGPLAWHRDFADARHRLREWVSTCGARLDRDRPTRQTAWPGEPPAPPAPETPVTDRDEDFVQFVLADVTNRSRGTSLPSRGR